jgi:predicted CopG family antitoxin
MTQKTVKAIHVEEDVWLTFIKLKYELRYRNMSDVIRHLLEKCGYMNTQAPSDGV